MWKRGKSARKFPASPGWVYGMTKERARKFSCGGRNPKLPWSARQLADPFPWPWTGFRDRDLHSVCSTDCSKVENAFC